MSNVPLELRAGDLRLALRPDLGGAIAGFWLGDTAVLRGTEATELSGARLSGCYPLVPYSNRLGYRRFRWLGHEHTTQPNFDEGNPHSVHGVAWQRPWSVLSSSAAAAELSYTHAADAHWPFAFEAQQRFVLSADALELQLSITNRANAPQPAGIDGDVAHLGFDNCFEGWKGPARIRDEKLSLRLTSSLPYLVVFTPATKPYYCVEPVSHVSNAIHMSDPPAHGLLALAPGATFEAWMKLEVEHV